MKQILQIHPHYRLQWEESQQQYVLLYAEGMIQLNDSAAIILQLCDGKHTIEDIIDSLQKRFPEIELKADITSFIKEAHDHGWVIGY